jgi:hypothetical protein
MKRFRFGPAGQAGVVLTGPRAALRLGFGLLTHASLATLNCGNANMLRCFRKADVPFVAGRIPDLKCRALRPLRRVGDTWLWLCPRGTYRAKLIFYLGENRHIDCGFLWNAPDAIRQSFAIIINRDR